ncbi:hypothetical protein BDZ89DRAFT_1044881 [Hymenopellis radicata]|nr:hypothetical protein BDZ89DRAFT_1044881 [Hymenopellis radicata]
MSPLHIPLPPSHHHPDASSLAHPQPPSPPHDNPLILTLPLNVLQHIVRLSAYQDGSPLRWGATCRRLLDVIDTMSHELPFVHIDVADQADNAQWICKDSPRIRLRVHHSGCIQFALDNCYRLQTLIIEAPISTVEAVATILSSADMPHLQHLSIILLFASVDQTFDHPSDDTLDKLSPGIRQVMKHGRFCAVSLLLAQDTPKPRSYDEGQQFVEAAAGTVYAWDLAQIACPSIYFSSRQATGILRMQRPGPNSLAQELVDSIAEWSLTEEDGLDDFQEDGLDHFRMPAVYPSPRTMATARNLLATHRAFRDKAQEVLFRTILLAADDSVPSSPQTPLPYRPHSWNTVQEMLSSPRISSIVRQFGFVGATSLEHITDVSARCRRVNSLILVDVDLAILETVQPWPGPTRLCFAGICGSTRQIPAAKRLAPDFKHLRFLLAWDLRWHQVSRPISLDTLSLQVTRRSARIPLYPDDTVYVGLHVRRVEVVVINGKLIKVDHALRGVQGVEVFDLNLTECEPVFEDWQSTELRLSHWTNLKHVSMRFHYSSALAIARTLNLVTQTASLQTTRLTVFLQTCGERNRARTENTLTTFSNALLYSVKAGGTLELNWVWVIGFMVPTACLPDRQWERVLATPRLAERAFPDRVVVRHHGVHARHVSRWDWNGRVG